MGRPDRQKFVANLRGVTEVSLAGDADLSFWTDRLAQHDLVPEEREGRARILLIASSARYMLMRFRELSVSVIVPSMTGDAGFLVQAFNSRRFFAWSERKFFSTPYRHADVRLSAAPPAIHVSYDGKTAFHATMGELGDRDPVIQPDAAWRGRVFVPGPRNDPRFFVAKIEGEAVVCPFSASEDLIELAGDGAAEVFHLLRDSGFTPREWIIRRNATHAKSKTQRVP